MAVIIKGNKPDVFVSGAATPGISSYGPFMLGAATLDSSSHGHFVSGAVIPDICENLVT